MRVLNLAYNDLHSLNQDLFEHLPQLEELDISGNPLTTIDHVTLIAISSLPMLKVSSDICYSGKSLNNLILSFE